MGYNPYIMLENGNAIHKDEIRSLEVFRGEEGFRVQSISDHVFDTLDSHYEADMYLRQLCKKGRVKNKHKKSFAETADILARQEVVDSFQPGKDMFLRSLFNIHKMLFNKDILSDAVDYLCTTGNIVAFGNEAKRVVYMPPIPNWIAGGNMACSLFDWMSYKESEKKLVNVMCDNKPAPSYPVKWAKHMLDILCGLGYLQKTILPDNPQYILQQKPGKEPCKGSKDGFYVIDDIFEALRLSADKLELPLEFWEWEW